MPWMPWPGKRELWWQEVGLEEKNLRPREARQRAAETFLEIEDFGQAGAGAGAGRAGGQVACNWMNYPLVMSK